MTILFIDYYFAVWFVCQEPFVPYTTEDLHNTFGCVSEDPQSLGCSRILEATYYRECVDKFTCNE